jgi:hypothetical protein
MTLASTAFLLSSDLHQSLNAGQRHPKTDCVGDFPTCLARVLLALRPPYFRLAAVVLGSLRRAHGLISFPRPESTTTSSLYGSEKDTNADLALFGVAGLVRASGGMTTPDHIDHATPQLHESNSYSISCFWRGFQDLNSSESLANGNSRKTLP